MKTSDTARSAFRERCVGGLLTVALATLCLMLGAAPAAAQGHPSVVGLWHVELVKQDGSLFYQSLQEYHADGLEIELAALAPLHPGHACMGVWKQDGNAIQIYHVVWMYDGDKAPVMYSVLTEKNTLSRDGNALKGTFDLKQFHIGDGSPAGEIQGTTAARRIDFSHPFSLFGTGAAGSGSGARGSKLEAPAGAC